jgi:catechol 2,3-dioxygenase-like lactoylglutathione lyase family enzyme
VWTGHLTVKGTDLAASAAFYRDLGMREVMVRPDVAIFELRGGTHLVVQRQSETDGGPTHWDLMVEDVHGAHDDWERKGLAVSPVTKGSIHETFVVTDPDGNTIEVNSSHVVGPV